MATDAGRDNEGIYHSNTRVYAQHSERPDHGSWSDAMDIIALFHEKQSWHKDAACLGAFAEGGHNIFFAEDVKSRARALEVCARCPVTEQCGWFGEQNHEPNGIWGGEKRVATKKPAEIVDTILPVAEEKTQQSAAINPARATIIPVSTFDSLCDVCGCHQRDCAWVYLPGTAGDDLVACADCMIAKGYMPIPLRLLEHEECG